MGGAGTWHIGLHHPTEFCVIGPGAGFTTTHGYIGEPAEGAARLPGEVPAHLRRRRLRRERVQRARSSPTAARRIAQKKAADNIENALKSFKEPLQFTHLVAPGLEHQMPTEWQDKAEVEYRKYADKGRDRIRTASGS